MSPKRYWKPFVTTVTLALAACGGVSAEEGETQSKSESVPETLLGVNFAPASHSILGHGARGPAVDLWYTHDGINVSQLCKLQENWNVILRVDYQSSARGTPLSGPTDDAQLSEYTTKIVQGLSLLESGCPGKTWRIQLANEVDWQVLDPDFYAKTYHHVRQAFHAQKPGLKSRYLFLASLTSGHDLPAFDYARALLKSLRARGGSSFPYGVDGLAPHAYGFVKGSAEGSVASFKNAWMQPQLQVMREEGFVGGPSGSVDLYITEMNRVTYKEIDANEEQLTAKFLKDVYAYLVELQKTNPFLKAACWYTYGAPYGLPEAANYAMVQLPKVREAFESVWSSQARSTRQIRSAPPSSSTAARATATRCPCLQGYDNVLLYPEEVRNNECAVEMESFRNNDAKVNDCVEAGGTPGACAWDWVEGYETYARLSRTKECR